MDFFVNLEAHISSLKDGFFMFLPPDSCALLMYNGWGKSFFLFGIFCEVSLE